MTPTERPRGDYDTTEKLERTDVGFRYTVECKRGTGTRDQDKVKAELRSETMSGPDTCDDIIREVKASMTDLRSFNPDEEADE